MPTHSTHTVTSHLGHSILVVLDSTPAFHDALRTAVASLPEVDRRSFTLVCCCPPRFWEHGGGEPQAVAAEARHVWEAEERDFNRAERCLQHASSLLREAGVPQERIAVRIITQHNRLLPAVMAELHTRRYTGVILSAYHTGIISRLERRGVTDLFRSVPDVVLDVLDTRATASAR